MGFWSPETTWKNQPGVDPYLDALRSFRPGLGPGGKRDRKFLRRADDGEDISSFGMFNTIRQAGAAERRGIEDQYMTGANQLLAQSGGDQGALMNRLRMLETDRQREREGMQLTGALADETGAASNRLQNAYQFKSGLDLEARRAALQGKLGSGTWATESGLGGQLLGSAISGATGALTGGWMNSLMKFKPKVPSGYGTQS